MERPWACLRMSSAAVWSYSTALEGTLCVYAQESVKLRRPQIAFQTGQGDKTCIGVVAFSNPVGVSGQPGTPLTEACPGLVVPKPLRSEHEPPTRDLLLHRTASPGNPPAWCPRSQREAAARSLQDPEGLFFRYRARAKTRIRRNARRGVDA